MCNGITTNLHIPCRLGRSVLRLPPAGATRIESAALNQGRPSKNVAVAIDWGSYSGGLCNRSPTVLEGDYVVS